MAARRASPSGSNAFRIVRVLVDVAVVGVTGLVTATVPGVKSTDLVVPTIVDHGTIPANVPGFIWGRYFAPNTVELCFWNPTGAPVAGTDIPVNVTLVSAE